MLIRLRGDLLALTSIGEPLSVLAYLVVLCRPENKCIPEDLFMLGSKCCKVNCLSSFVQEFAVIKEVDAFCR